MSLASCCSLKCKFQQLSDFWPGRSWRTNLKMLSHSLPAALIAKRISKKWLVFIELSRGLPWRHRKSVHHRSPTTHVGHCMAYAKGNNPHHLFTTNQSLSFVVSIFLLSSVLSSTSSKAVSTDSQQTVPFCSTIFFKEIIFKENFGSVRWFNKDLHKICIF